MINPEFEVVSIPQAVGTVATNGILCGIKSVVMVSIPQAVGTVATRRFKNESIKRNEPVSIPQAVGTVATQSILDYMREKITVEFQYRKR